jgi:hypothetical protein
LTRALPSLAMVESLLPTPTMVSAVNRVSSFTFSLSCSTVNQQLHQLIPIQMPTMLLLRRRQLPPPPPMVANLLVVGPGLTALLAVLVIVALNSEARGGEPRLLGARLMHPLFVFALMTAKKIFTYCKGSPGPQPEQRARCLRSEYPHN